MVLIPAIVRNITSASRARKDRLGRGSGRLLENKRVKLAIGPFSLPLGPIVSERSGRVNEANRCFAFYYSPATARWKNKTVSVSNGWAATLAGFPHLLYQGVVG